MSESQMAGSAAWIRIRNAAGHVGETVEIRGWVTHRRSSGKVQFLVVRDGSGNMQCVAGVKDLSPEQWEATAQLTTESAVVVRGVLKSDPQQVGGVEMGLQSVEVVSVAHEYPIAQEHGVDFLMDHRHLGCDRAGSSRCCAFAPRSSRRSATS
jgi:asparaginyl-tRNA synthetase